MANREIRVNLSWDVDRFVAKMLEAKRRLDHGSK